MHTYLTINYIIFKANLKDQQNLLDMLHVECNNNVLSLFKESLKNYKKNCNSIFHKSI